MGAGRRRHRARRGTSAARTSSSGGWTCPAAGPAGSGPGTSTASTSRPAAASTPGRVLRVPADVLRERSDAWFPFGGHLIEGLYRTARTIESTARQRESLVTLGTLAAGLAHEINNPAAAATRAVDALEEACQTLLSSLGRLADGRDLGRPVHRARRAAPGDRAAASAAVDPLARRRPRGRPLRLARRARRRARLGHRPAAGRRRRRRRLVRAGRRRAGRRRPRARRWSGWPARSRRPRCSAEVKESTRRVSELVGAVRSYSQMDRASLQRDRRHRGAREHAGDARPQAPRRGHGRARLRRRRAADRGVRRRAEPGLDQPDRQRRRRDGRRGHAAVATRADGDDVVVEIADTGTGHAAGGRRPARSRRSSRPRTSGKGTGLGLDIARRIVVDRHGGTIAIDSVPGATTLRIRLPIRRP